VRQQQNFYSPHGDAISRATNTNKRRTDVYPHSEIPSLPEHVEDEPLDDRHILMYKDMNSRVPKGDSIEERLVVVFVERHFHESYCAVIVSGNQSHQSFALRHLVVRCYLEDQIHGNLNLKNCVDDDGVDDNEHKCNG
jgi:hypothetical protein